LAVQPEIRGPSLPTGGKQAGNICRVGVKRFQVSVFSAAVGLKSGQFDQKRNFGKTNVEYRIPNVEYRRNVFFRI
jgi:hypothetical protein